MRVAVIGATGVLGRYVLPRLIERGHDVRAIVRSPAQAAHLARFGIDAVRGDILDPSSLAPALAGCAAALNLATAVPRPGMKRDFARNDAIRRDGTRHFIAACRAAGVERLMQQSIAHLVAGHGDAVVDETTPLNPTAATTSAAEMEATVQASGLRWTILRGGAFYGAGTGRDEEWRGLARSGAWRLPGDGTAYVSLIHAADMADAVVLAAEIAPPEAVLSVVDDEPVTYRTLFAWIAALEDGPEPQPGGPAPGPSCRVANARARAALGWRPRLASFRSGFA